MGDVAVNYAACDKAREELGWAAEYDLERMCADGWRWQSQNPNGCIRSNARKREALRRKRQGPRHTSGGLAFADPG